MRMSDFVVREAVVPSLTAATKEGVIREMFESLRESGYLRGADADAILKAIMKREQLGSTGIGRGVAIPHAKHDSVDRLIGTVAVSHSGVNFDAIDNDPVYIFVMLLSPQNPPGEHLRALDVVTRSLRDDMFCRFLRQANTREAIVDLLNQADGTAR
jgi:mannitol/fructose-specific phosphotransferase system IIA component (Ntr-type)